MLQVRLEPGLPGGHWACIRPSCGHDEQSLAHAAGATAAVELLDRLLLEVPGTSVGPGRAWQLAVCDRDRLLAAIYADNFDDRVESEVPCEQCGEVSEIDFSLAAMVEEMATRARASTERDISGPDEDGAYVFADGARFRLPNSEDQRAVFGTRPEHQRTALLRRCILDHGGGEDRRTPSDLPGELLDRVEAAMEVVGPTLDADLAVSCHECGATRSVRFDIQHFLLRAFEHERRFFVREVHYLACTYGWSLAEILELSREDRRSFVRLVAAERASRQRQMRSLS